MQDTPDVPGDLPEGLGTLARRSLTRAGYTRLEQLTSVRASELSRLRGMGSKAVAQIRVALAARGESLAEEDGQ
jgi:DNA-directed RNA polymerase alpha subunit